MASALLVLSALTALAGSSSGPLSDDKNEILALDKQIRPHLSKIVCGWRPI